MPAPTLQSTLEDENGSGRTTDVGLKMCAENHGLMMQGNEVTEVMPGVPPVVSPSVSLPDAAVPLGGGMRAEAKARAERKMSLVQLRDNPLVQEMADRAALEVGGSRKGGGKGGGKEGGRGGVLSPLLNTQTGKVDEAGMWIYEGQRVKKYRPFGSRGRARRGRDRGWKGGR